MHESSILFKQQIKLEPLFPTLGVFFRMTFIAPDGETSFTMLRSGAVESLLPFKGSSETPLYLPKVKLGTRVLGSNTWLQVLSTPQWAS